MCCGHVCSRYGSILQNIYTLGCAVMYVRKILPTIHGYSKRNRLFGGHNYNSFNEIKWNIFFLAKPAIFFHIAAEAIVRRISMNFVQQTTKIRSDLSALLCKTSHEMDQVGVMRVTSQRVPCKWRVATANNNKSQNSIEFTQLFFAILADNLTIGLESRQQFGYKEFFLLDMLWNVRCTVLSYLFSFRI